MSDYRFNFLTMCLLLINLICMNADCVLSENEIKRLILAKKNDIVFLNKKQFMKIAGWGPKSCTVRNLADFSEYRINLTKNCHIWKIKIEKKDSQFYVPQHRCIVGHILFSQWHSLLKNEITGYDPFEGK